VQPSAFFRVAEDSTETITGKAMLHIAVHWGCENPPLPIANSWSRMKTRLFPHDPQRIEILWRVSAS
jgi:hypothetical protein